MRVQAFDVLSTDGTGFVYVNEWQVRRNEGCA
jgi:hypothetical protein